MANHTAPHRLLPAHHLSLRDTTDQSGTYHTLHRRRRMNTCMSAHSVNYSTSSTKHDPPSVLEHDYTETGSTSEDHTTLARTRTNTGTNTQADQSLRYKHRHTSVVDGVLYHAPPFTPPEFPQIHDHVHTPNYSPTPPPTPRPNLTISTSGSSTPSPPTPTLIHIALRDPLADAYAEFSPVTVVDDEVRMVTGATQESLLSGEDEWKVGGVLMRGRRIVRDVLGKARRGLGVGEGNGEEVDG